MCGAVVVRAQRVRIRERAEHARQPGAGRGRLLQALRMRREEQAARLSLTALDGYRTKRRPGKRGNCPLSAPTNMCRTSLLVRLGLVRPGFLGRPHLRVRELFAVVN